MINFNSTNSKMTFFVSFKNILFWLNYWDFFNKMVFKLIRDSFNLKKNPFKKMFFDAIAMHRFVWFKINLFEYKKRLSECLIIILLIFICIFNSI